MSLGMPLIFYNRACIIRCVPIVGRGVTRLHSCCQLWREDKRGPRAREPDKKSVHSLYQVYRSMPSSKIRKTKRKENMKIEQFRIQRHLVLAFSTAYISREI